MDKTQDAHGAIVDAADGSIVDSIESKILNIRGKQVMLDRDLAMLYGVETKVLNQAVKRNIERFPDDFMFQLSYEECSRSQIVTLNIKRGHNIKYFPYAFTEEGVAALSGVLHSKIAIKANINIMRAFVKMRHNILSFSGHEQRIDAIERHLIETDQKIDHVLNCLEEGTLKEKAHIFSAGQIFEAKAFITELINKADVRIVLIDGYVSAETLELLDARKDGVQAEVYTYSVGAALHNLEIQYNNEYPSKPLVIRKWCKEQHDRWLIIDDELWHCGASLKDAGEKTFGIDHIGLDARMILSQI